ncbi:MAG: glycosyltransferase [Deltaproteobacteria bacterium]|nr:glycosyltransferase [Deltaproteobacteria bacterium]
MDPFGGFIAVIAAVAVLIFAANVKLARTLKRLDTLEVPSPTAWPKLSVIVPACNEGDTISPALATLRALDYPNFELVLIDDRSNDATTEHMQAAKEADPRVIFLRVDTLPEGWLGKVHALHQGVHASSGELILFTDADVTFKPEALRRSVAYFLDRKLDHLCVVPDITSRSMIASVMIATALRGIAISQRPWHTENPKRKETIGGGAFNMVRRSFFDSTPGFEWLRLEVADDIGLAHMMKQAGGRASVLIARGLVAVEWYPSFRTAMRGMEKNGFAQLARYRVWRGLGIAALFLVMSLSPFLALFHSSRFVNGAGALTIVASLASGVLVALATGSPILPQLLASPLGDVLVAFMVARATILGAARGGLIWRGTVYPTAALRDGMRVKF